MRKIMVVILLFALIAPAAAMAEKKFVPSKIKFQLGSWSSKDKKIFRFQGLKVRIRDDYDPYVRYHYIKEVASHLGVPVRLNGGVMTVGRKKYRVVNAKSNPYNKRGYVSYVIFRGKKYYAAFSLFSGFGFDTGQHSTSSITYFNQKD